MITNESFYDDVYTHAQEDTNIIILSFTPLVRAEISFKVFFFFLILQLTQYGDDNNLLYFYTTFYLYNIPL